MENWVQSWRPHTNAFAIFPFYLSKVVRLPRKSEARSCEVLHLWRKIILGNLKTWCSKMQPHLRKSVPWPPNISDEHVSCIAPAARNVSLQILVFGNAAKPSRFAHFWEGAESLAPATQTTSERPKVVRACDDFTMFTSKCASGHNGVHFFDMSTSKSGPSMVCFARFDFEMCFAPQRRALFRHVNFHKWSEHVAFCTF